MIIDCPRCGTKHVATSNSSRQPDDANSTHVLWEVERCQNPDCRRLIVVVTQNGVTVRTWPAASYELDAALNLKAELRGDYQEAGLCLDAGCFKASLVMSRRALQRVLKEQGC